MRFYVPQINTSNVELSGSAHTHAAYALRIRTGDVITVFDGKGIEYNCIVKEIKKDKTILDIVSTQKDKREARISVSLYLSAIKPDKFELAVQKATELGVYRIVPVYTTYTQRGNKLNIERLNKIAVSACEQCGRSRLPIIEQPIEFDELLNRTKKSYMIFPWECERTGNINTALSKAENKSDISLFIGPEGGITESEKNRLSDAGAHTVTLGPRILRAETAAVSALSVIYCRLGEWEI